MLRFQDFFSRIPDTFSGAHLHATQQADEPLGRQTHLEDDAEATTAVGVDGREQAARQAISAFMPLSRWIARVHTPESGTHDA